MSNLRFPIAGEPSSRLDSALETVYGDSHTGQTWRYQEAIRRFIEFYGVGPIHIFRAPGRVNLVGEHTDYNHGFVLPAALDKDILLLARPRQDLVVRVANYEPEYRDATFHLDRDIPSAPTGDWTNYMRGACQMLVSQAAGSVCGFDGLVAGASPYGVPRGSGLSSSSALTVVTAVALAHFAAIEMASSDFALLCAEAEWYVGTRGGVMDHFASLLAERDHVLFLDCRPGEGNHYSAEHIPFPSSFRILVVDSGIHHSNVRGEFNQRVAACRAGVALLRAQYPGITHLRDVQEYPWEDLQPLLPERVNVGDLGQLHIDIGDIPGLSSTDSLRIRACCRHVWHENLRVLSVLDAFRGEKIGEVGELLSEAHASARHDYRISTPELDLLVESALNTHGVAGARLTGAGWGGCIVALVHEDSVDDLQERVRLAYVSGFGRAPAMFLCRAGSGAGLVTILEGQ